MNLLLTARTYATQDNALKALKKAVGNDLTGVRYLIAVNEDNRFAPVLVGVQYVPFAHVGITVVG